MELPTGSKIRYVIIVCDGGPNQSLQSEKSPERAIRNGSNTDLDHCIYYDLESRVIVTRCPVQPQACLLPSATSSFPHVPRRSPCRPARLLSFFNS